MKQCFTFVLACFLLSISAQAQTLTQKADFPGSGRFRCFSFFLNGKMYVGGGRQYPAAPPAMADFWVYDPAADAWTQLADLPFGARSNIRAMVIDGKAYTGLGYDGNGTDPASLHNDFWEYEPQTDTWEQKADFPAAARYQPTMFAYGGKGYVFGGSNKLSGGSGGTDFNDVWEYNPTANTWTQKADFPGEGRMTAFAAPDADGVYVGLGYMSNLSNFFSDVWKYNPVADTWESLPALPGTANVPVVDGGCSFYAIYNDKLLLSNINLNGTAWEDYHTYFVLDLATQTWTAYENANPIGNRDDWAFGTNNNLAYMSLGWDGSTFYTETWELDMADFLTAIETANPGIANINITAANGAITAVIPQEVAQKYVVLGLTLALYAMNGQQMAAFNLQQGNQYSMMHLPAGAYVWAVQANSKPLKGGKILR